MREPARYFPYLEHFGNPIHEVLLAPFFDAGSPVGTLWVLSLSESKRFDAEDLRLLQSLSTLAGVMVETSSTMRALNGDRERKARLLDDQENALKTMTALFDQAPGLMAILKGPTHRFEMANRAYYDFVGPRDIIGKPVFEALPEAKGQGFEELLDRVIQTGQPYVGRAAPIQLQRRPGEPPVELYLDFVYQPIHGPDDTTLGIFVQGHGVTDRERALKRLEDADVRKDAFLATLAHELRNPLGPIRVATHLLGHSVPESQQPIVAVIDRQSAVLATLVNGLMDVASIRSGKIALVRQWTSVQEILAGALEVVRPRLDARRHALSVEMPEKPLPLFADPLRLTQVLTNLLTNAGKYTPDEGSIVAVVTETPDEITISVRDSGIGIDPVMLPKVFEMFSQSAQSLTRSEGGLGIGLALVRQLVELHNGTVVAYSAGVGEGSQFTIHLPKTRDEAL
jgi:signal transduction histidine kinase